MGTDPCCFFTCSSSDNADTIFRVSSTGRPPICEMEANGNCFTIQCLQADDKAVGTFINLLRHFITAESTVLKLEMFEVSLRPLAPI